MKHLSLMNFGSVAMFYLFFKRYFWPGRLSFHLHTQQSVHLCSEFKCEDKDRCFIHIR